mmetsp:Transcript_56261/g.164422  ORF Transcript_56261/g.164422 Transcript_56261/m.164422 type:complete len:203 (-) Transcript_56261:674-1282(-)
MLEVAQHCVFEHACAAGPYHLHQVPHTQAPAGRKLSVARDRRAGFEREGWRPRGVHDEQGLRQEHSLTARLVLHACFLGGRHYRLCHAGHVPHIQGLPGDQRALAGLLGGVHALLVADNSSRPGHHHGGRPCDLLLRVPLQGMPAAGMSGPSRVRGGEDRRLQPNSGPPQGSLGRRLLAEPGVAQRRQRLRPGQPGSARDGQ